MTAEIIEQARNGDQDAFARLVEPFRREIEVHCYRILGSAQDAEDLLQETMLAAWQGLHGFEERASLRSWLYRIATNRCLNALRATSRRPTVTATIPNVEPPEPTRVGEVVWLEPYPDLLLDELPDDAPGPDARYETRETVSLAFIRALQLLPPRQRAALILRDVLGFRASEAAEMLDTTEEAITSALKRARAAVQAQTQYADRQPPPPADSAAERELADKLTRAYESGDIDGLVALMSDDVWLTMPPVPLEYQGRALVAKFFEVVAFRDARRYRLVPTRANGQPAFGVYGLDPHGGPAHAFGLVVITLAGDRITAMTRFDNSVLARFGLPRTLPLR